jgi:hypothetical protein
MGDDGVNNYAGNYAGNYVDDVVASHMHVVAKMASTTPITSTTPTAPTTTPTTAPTPAPTHTVAPTTASAPITPTPPTDVVDASNDGDGDDGDGDSEYDEVDSSKSSTGDLIRTVLTNRGEVDNGGNSPVIADDIIRAMTNEAGVKATNPQHIIGGYESPARLFVRGLLTDITGITNHAHMKKIIKVYMNTVDKREPTPALFNELRTRIDDIIKNPNTPMETNTVIADYIKFIESPVNHKHWWLIDIDRLRGIINKQR